MLMLKNYVVMIPKLCEQRQQCRKLDGRANSIYVRKFSILGHCYSKCCKNYVPASFPALSSARQGLTSVFGMGTGVTLAVGPPGNLLSKLEVRNSSRCNCRVRSELQSFDEQLKEAGYNNRSFPLENIAMWKGCLTFLPRVL
jgi:hypothetical protein